MGNLHTKAKGSIDSEIVLGFYFIINASLGHIIKAENREMCFHSPFTKVGRWRHAQALAMCMLPGLPLSDTICQQNQSKNICFCSK